MRLPAAPLAALLAVVTLATTGCASMAQKSVADNLGRAVQNQDDPATVRAGAPAFLLLLDGLLEGDPENVDLLLANARLNGAYAGIFVDDRERGQRLAQKAHGYAKKAVCLQRKPLCEAADRPLDDFKAALGKTSAGDVPLLYVYGTTWAGVIQQQAGWEQVAELPKVEAVMERVVALDEGYDNGQAHVYLGALNSLVPPALGGQPENGRTHFERAIELSQGRNLMAKVEYARRYARLVFDRPLHDRLLNEVVEAPVEAPGLTLANSIAKTQARELLASAPLHFPE